MFRTGGSVSYSIRIEAKEYLCGGLFFNTNPRDGGVQVLLPQKELSKLLDDSPNIFKKSYIDCYMERKNATFCNRKYSMLDDFCYAEFLVYYTPENKSSKTGKYNPDELDDNLLENNHKEYFYHQMMKLLISRETMRRQKVR